MVDRCPRDAFAMANKVLRMYLQCAAPMGSKTKRVNISQWIYINNIVRNAWHLEFASATEKLDVEFSLTQVE